MARRAAAAPAKLTADTRLLVLHGPNDMAKRAYLQQLRDTLEKAHGEVEVFRFDGKAATLADVLDELRSYSLMQTYKLVLVDDADAFVKQHREALERYAQQPVDHATLILRSDAWHAGKLDKLIAKTGAVVKCEMPSPAEASRWLVERAKAEYGRTLQPRAATALVQRLGTDQFKLDSELAKLCLMVEERAAVDVALVEQVVGRGSEEQAWAVQEAVLNAMTQRSTGAMIAAAHELVDLAGQPPVLVTYFVADLVRKINVALLMKRAGANDMQVGKALKLWGPRQQLFMRVLRQMDERTARRLFERIVAADAGAKSGLGEPMRNLECFFVEAGAKG